MKIFVITKKTGICLVAVFMLMLSLVAKKLLGKNGEMLKKIGKSSREEIERLSSNKVFLELWVKVKENWRESAKTVGNFGYHDEE